MKKLFLLVISSFIYLLGFSQANNISVGKLTVSQSVTLRGNRIDSISADGTFTNSGNDVLVTQGAIKAYITSKFVPAGSSTQIQYNNGGSFGGVSGFTYNGTAVSLNGILNLLVGATTGGSGFKAIIEDTTSSGKVATIPYFPLDTTGYYLGKTAVVFNGSGFVMAFPPYAAKGDLTAQTAPVNIIAYGVPGSGSSVTFRVGGYINVTAISTDVIALQISYTDENGTSRTQNLYSPGASSGVSSVSSNGFPSIVIRVQKGTTIIVATILTTSGGSVTYDSGGVISQLY